MAELFELIEGTPRYAPSGLAETLVPMLDDLARAFGSDRGLIAVYDERRHSLRGVSGHNLRPELVEALDLQLDQGSSIMATALETGAPQRVDEVARDARLSESTRQILLEAGFQKTVIVREPQRLSVAAMCEEAVETWPALATRHHSDPATLPLAA